MYFVRGIQRLILWLLLEHVLKLVMLTCNLDQIVQQREAAWHAINNGLSAHIRALQSKLNTMKVVVRTDATHLTMRDKDSGACKKCTPVLPLLVVAFQTALQDLELWPLPTEKSINSTLEKLAGLEKEAVHQFGDSDKVSVGGTDCSCFATPQALLLSIKKAVMVAAPGLCLP